MKTKIIYISGSEVFDMADIRAAFDQVRTALGLTDDTVLFGVPVDKDDAIKVPTVDATPTVTVAVAAEEIVAQPVVDEVIEEEPAPAKKTKRASKRVREEEVEVVPAVTEDATDEIVTGAAPAVADDAPVIPILSVLGVKAAATEVAKPTTEEEPVSALDVAEEDTMPEDMPVDEEIAVDTPVDIDMDVVQDAPDVEFEQVEVVDVAPTAEPEVVIETVSVAVEVPATEEITEPVQDEPDIDTLVSDDTPAASTEKTLEQLLESMTPLREDVAEEEPIAQQVTAPQPEPVAEPMPSFENDDDATLAQLADDFINAQDKLPTANNSGRGKISKLKSIIPFKRKQEDNGLMSDLFGWAGMAANDDEYTIPGFFTPK